MMLLRTALGAFFTALVAAAYAISFAAIIYTGDLGQFMGRGIGLTLLGAAIVSLIGAFTLSYRGSILGPQDVPAILISTSAATLMAGSQLPPDAHFATTACLIAVCSLFAGIAGILVGQFRLAHISRFFPYPVLAGFLATTGLLLLMAGISIALDKLSLTSPISFLTSDAIIRWGPVIAIATLMVAATRIWDGFLVMPITLLAALVGFYAFYAVLGLSFADLRTEKLLLGPFQTGGFWQSIDPTLPAQADWGQILRQAPLILTVSAATLIGATLNASGLELQLDRDFEINQEVKSTGFANVVSGLAGGIPGYHVVGETVLANKLGLLGPAAGLSAAFGCGLLLFGGAGLLAYFPTGYFAAVISYLGIDLLYKWFWEERKRFGWSDYAIVAIIPIVAVGFGFLTAIALGLVMACAFFVVACARLDIIRFHSDVSKRRSRVERPVQELNILTEMGGSAKIAELSGFLFFGTSSALRAQVRSLLQDSSDIKWLILDFRRVSGVDLSTQHVMARIASDCAAQNVTLLLTHADSRVVSELQKTDLQYSVHPTLDDAIELIEEDLIDAANQDAEPTASLFDQLIRTFETERLDEYAQTQKLDAGETVFAQEVRSQDIYFLRSGKLQVKAGIGSGKDVVVAHIRRGTVVGEMAFYTDGARSAKIVATEPSTLICFKMDAFAQLEEEHPSIAATFHRLMARVMARRLQRTTQLISDLRV